MGWKIHGDREYRIRWTSSVLRGKMTEGKWTKRQVISFTIPFLFFIASTFSLFSIDSSIFLIFLPSPSFLFYSFAHFSNWTMFSHDILSSPTVFPICLLSCIYFVQFFINPFKIFWRTSQPLWSEGRLGNLILPCNITNFLTSCSFPCIRWYFFHSSLVTQK